MDGATIPLRFAPEYVEAVETLRLGAAPGMPLVGPGWEEFRGSWEAGYAQVDNVVDLPDCDPELIKAAQYWYDFDHPELCMFFPGPDEWCFRAGAIPPRHQRPATA